MKQKFLFIIPLTLIVFLIFGAGSQIIANMHEQNSFSVPGVDSGTYLEIELIGNNAYRVSLDNFKQVLPQKHLIRLDYQTFDPLRDSVRMEDPGLSSVGGYGESLWIVQFHTQAFEALQDELSIMGAEVIEPLPDHALIVLMDENLSLAVAEQPFVRWVGPYHAAYKIATPTVQLASDYPDEAVCYSIWLSDAQLQRDVVDTIDQIGGTTPGIGDSRRMEALLTQAQLMDVAQMNEVLSIDECVEMEDDADGVREASGANYIETVQGYTGQGVGAEVIDRGMRLSHQDFQANPLILHSPDHNPSDMNHGTECAGIVFGSGASDYRARGLMPDAARPIVASRFSLWSGGSPSLSQRKSHTRELLNSPYRAVLQTSSWGGTRVMTYTTISAEMDEILFELDFTMLQSQSNAGNRDSRPQAWAKNMISVGGITNGDTVSRSNDCWCSSASIGPADDGRIKPDLSHFYGNIYTVDDISDTAHREFGGTSGATPATAGLIGLMHQMWADGILDGGPGKNRDVFNTRPHMTTAKALMINTAYEYAFSGQNHDLTRVHQGWGMADVKRLYDMARDHNWKFPVLIDESAVISPTKTHSYTVNCNGSKDLRATMVFADPPGNPSASIDRINDLTLKVISPSGTVYWGNNGLLDGNYSTSGGTANTVDTVENVFVKNAASGPWTIEVIGAEIVMDGHFETSAMDADYALIVSGGTTGTGPDSIHIKYECNG